MTKNKAHKSVIDKEKVLVSIISLLFLISFSSALKISESTDIDGVLIHPLNNAETNYSLVNVNNSLYWQGHTGTDGSWLTGILYNYNHTLAVYNLWNAIWSSTYNATYHNKAGTGNCPAGQVVQNTTTSGVQCVTSSSGVGNPFNQILNTTNNVTFNSVKAKYGNFTDVTTTTSCTGGEVYLGDYIGDEETCIAFGGTWYGDPDYYCDGYITCESLSNADCTTAEGYGMCSLTTTTTKRGLIDVDNINVSRIILRQNTAETAMTIIGDGDGGTGTRGYIKGINKDTGRTMWILTDTNAGNTGMIALGGYQTSANSYFTELDFFNYASGAGDKRNAIIQAVTDAASNRGQLAFFTASGTSLNANMLLKANGRIVMKEGGVSSYSVAPSSTLSIGGNVVIGTTSYLTTAAPTNGLLVDGNAVFKSTVNATGYTTSTKTGKTTSNAVVTSVDFLGSVYTTCTMNFTGGILTTDSTC